MKRLLFVFIGWLCTTTILYSQQIKEVNPDWIVQLNKNTSDTLYIINFWGTWCKPCLEEMPGIDSIQMKYAERKVKVILVSTDMKREYQNRLPSFVKERGYQSQVVWMNEPDGEKWIPLVSSSWSGLIPSTWILYRKNKFNYFREGQITFEELDKIIGKQLQP